MYPKDWRSIYHWFYSCLRITKLNFAKPHFSGIISLIKSLPGLENVRCSLLDCYYWNEWNPKFYLDVSRCEY